MALGKAAAHDEGFRAALDLLFSSASRSDRVARKEFKDEAAQDPDFTYSRVREVLAQASPDFPMTRTVAAFYLGISLKRLEQWVKHPDVKSPFKYGGRATKAEVEALAKDFITNKKREKRIDFEVRPIGGYWDSKGRFYLMDESGAILADAEFNGLRNKDIAVWAEAASRSGRDMEIFPLADAMAKPWTHASEKEPWLSRWTELLEHDIADAQAKLERAKLDLADTRATLLDERFPPGNGDESKREPF